MKRNEIHVDSNPINDAFEFIGVSNDEVDMLEYFESIQYKRDNFNKKLKSVKTFEELSQFIGYLKYFAFKLRGKRSNLTANEFSLANASEDSAADVSFVQYQYGFGVKAGKAQIQNLHRVLKVE